MTYRVRFSEEAKDYRMRMISLLDGVEMCEFPDGEVFIKCDDEETAECVEFELRRAESRDDFCDWGKVI